MNAELKWLDDPTVFRVNQCKAHSDHLFYADENECEKDESSLAYSLNGMWQFHYAENAARRPADFYREDAELSDFTTIQVPMHIELAGFGKIHYINTMYPWEGHVYRRPAGVPEDNTEGVGSFAEAVDNPVGSYRKTFVLPNQMRGKRIFIRFEGVEQAMFLWLNGSFVGYAEDSFTPSEFDLTPYIRDGENVLAAEVYKRSTAAYLEDQDFFRFFGIFRDVTLFAKPDVHVEDLAVRPTLDSDNQSAELSLTAELSGKTEGGSAALTLEDFRGEKLLEERLPVAERLEWSGKLAKVSPWSHKNPVLYRLVLRLYGAAGELLEVVPCEIGFRRLEVLDKVVYLNGERLILCGVNRHEWSAGGGRCIGREEMEQDMEVFRRLHINAVRTCHYPDQVLWYRLCDRDGIYVMAETNLESHGSWQKRGAVEPSWNVPGDSAVWKEAVLDRARSNYELLKNHPSVLFWSLGNESYAGTVLAEMNRFYKEKNDGRLVHYEGVFHNRSLEDVISDMESRMYASPQEVEEYLREHPKKPFVLCEYMHSMGNSVGGMGSYMRLLDVYPSFMGGFIWDYIDQAVLVEDEVTGKPVLRYGGDFDDRPSDYEFSGNGILFADRTEKPAAQEVGYYYGKYEA